MAIDDLPTVNVVAGGQGRKTKIARLAPAKINLALHVTGRRADGYHLLESLVVFAGVGDRISVKPTLADRLQTSGVHAADLNSDNLVIRARDALRDRFPGRTMPSVDIHLAKNLPVASGIGGGSSDAAATLKTLSELWQLQTDMATLCDIGLALGADVPMCLHGTPLIARGIGDQIAPISGFPALALVLVNSGVSVSTAEIFGLLDKPASPPLPLVENPIEFEAILELLGSTQNDLQEPALSAAPAIADTLNALTNTGAAFARMSGSGATCFGLFEAHDAAEKSAAAISQDHPDWFVQATFTKASTQ